MARFLEWSVEPVPRRLYPVQPEPLFIGARLTVVLPIYNPKGVTTMPPSTTPTQSLSMVYGDTRQFQLAITQLGVPVNLTGITSLNFILQRLYGSVGTVVANFGIGTGIVVTNAAGGIVTLTVTAAMVNWVRAAPSWTGELPWVADAWLRYSWALVDGLGNPTSNLDCGTFTLVAPS